MKNCLGLGSGCLTLIALAIGSLASIDAVEASCRAVAFPDNSSLGPLAQIDSDLNSINLASVAGLRTLEFGTNFQRRSANLIGQNPLIVASNDQAPQAGGAGAGDSELASKLSVLVSGFGATGNENSFSLNSEIDWNTVASALSVDYAVTPSSFVGVMLGVSSVDGCSAPQDNFTTAGSVNVVSNDVEGSFEVFSFYGIHESDSYYIDSIVSLGTGEFDFRRAQTVNGLRDENGFTLLERVNEVIVATTDGDLLRASIAGGLKFQISRIDLSPYARVSYARVNIDGYRELLDRGSSPGHPAPDSGGGFALRLTDQEVESLTSGAGLSAGYVFSTPVAVISIKGDFEWVHEFNNTTNSLNSALAGFSQGTISGAALAQRFPDRVLDSNYFLIGGGTSAVLNNGFQLFASIQALLGYENVSETHFGAGLRYEF